MNNNTTKQLTITLDQDLEWNIQRAMALEEEQKQYDGHDDKWQIIQDELNEVYYEIGFSIVYDIKQLPF